MNSFLAFLVLGFAVCLIAGLMKTDLFKWLPFGEITQKKIAIIFGSATIVAFVLFSLTMPPKEEAKEAEDLVQTQHTQTEPATEEKIETKTEVIAFTSSNENDPTLPKGQIKIRRL